MHISVYVGSEECPRVTCVSSEVRAGQSRPCGVISSLSTRARRGRRAAHRHQNCLLIAVIDDGERTISSFQRLSLSSQTLAERIYNEDSDGKVSKRIEAVQLKPLDQTENPISSTLPSFEDWWNE